MPTNRFPRIAFLDMEGTLLQKAHHLNDGIAPPSAWTLLAESLGPECLAAENQTKRNWRDGRYAGYLDWMWHTVALHQQFGLTRDIFLSVVNSVPLVRNASRALEAIHSWGTVSVLITGGFKALADRVQRELKIRHAFAGCEYFFDDLTGQLEHFNLLPADERGKVDFMRLVCREYAVSPADCVFIGDGMNDVHLAQAVGYSIAFNAQPELKAVASHRVDHPVGREDFWDVVEALQGIRALETRGE